MWGYDPQNLWAASGPSDSFVTSFKGQADPSFGPASSSFGSTFGRGGGGPRGALARDSPGARVRYVCLGASGRQLLTLADRNTVTVYELSPEGAPLFPGRAVLMGSRHFLSAAALAPDGKWVLALGETRTGMHELIAHRLGSEDPAVAAREAAADASFSKVDRGLRSFNKKEPRKPAEAEAAEGQRPAVIINAF